MLIFDFSFDVLQSIPLEINPVQAVVNVERHKWREMVIPGLYKHQKPYPPSLPFLQI